MEPVDSTGSTYWQRLGHSRHRVVRTAGVVSPAGLVIYGLMTLVYGPTWRNTAVRLGRLRRLQGSPSVTVNGKRKRSAEVTGGHNKGGVRIRFRNRGPLACRTGAVARLEARMADPPSGLGKLLVGMDRRVQFVFLALEWPGASSRGTRRHPHLRIRSSPNAPSSETCSTGRESARDGFCED